MKTKLFLILAALCASTYAADKPQEFKAAPPPPTMDAKDANDAKNGPDARNPQEEPVPGEPQVTITTQKEQTIEEYRVGGKLYMIKVTPKHGVPYYLVDDLGDGKFARREGLDSGVRVPRWVIKKF